VNLKICQWLLGSTCEILRLSTAQPLNPRQRKEQAKTAIDLMGHVWTASLRVGYFNSNHHGT
jgi:hypothetical protein